MEIVLASASPRRRELLEQIGWKYQILAADIDENLAGEDAGNPAGIVQTLARRKAEAAADAWEDAGRGPALVLGADTLVAIDGQVLGKPRDAREAGAMLDRLQGARHSVYTGVCLLRLDAAGERQVKVFYEQTLVDFYPMDAQEIEAYISSGEPMDKAGAYGIQGLGGAFIQGIEGDYTNVVGLPLGRLYQEAKGWTEA